MERVFPIRCTILGDSPHLTADHQKQGTNHSQIELFDSHATERSGPISNGWDASSAAIDLGQDNLTIKHFPKNTVDETLNDLPAEEALVYTERGEYAFASEKGHGFITGKRAQFTRCEDEEIHIPGTIQAHGMLVGLELIGDINPRYLVRVVSENSEAICKYTPRTLLALNDFLSIVSAPRRSTFHKCAIDVKVKFGNTGKSHEPKVFPIKFQAQDGKKIPVWCAVHFVGGRHNLLVCEFELRRRPNVKITSSDLPSTPYASVNSDPLDTASLDTSSSLTDKSTPLNVDLHDTFNEGNTMELLDVVSQVQHQLSSQKNIQGLSDTIVGLMMQLTGYHRCMVYRFDEDHNGKTIAELLNPRASSDIFKGLQFPSTDIPRQARILYKLNRVRLLFDREQAPCRLICRSPDDLEFPLDLTHSYLRAISPVHLHYLKNMGVRSTMSIALEYKADLWGLICCHSYGPTGQKVPFPVRELTYWLGLCASNNLDKLLNAERIQTRKAVSAMQLNFGPDVWLSASSVELLRLFRANFGFLVVRGEARTIGRLSSYLEAVTLLKYVYFRNFEVTFASRNITKDFPDLVFPPGFEHIAGVLIIPLSPAAGDFIIFVRACQIQEVCWAGNPNSKAEEGGKLEPRNSFKKWTEIVRGTCQPWTEEELEAAGMTRLVYGNFIRVWREKEADLQESRMKRVLLINLSHELRTPLNAVVNFLEMAMEKTRDKSIKSVLSMSHNATKSVIYVIDDLLNLTAGARQPAPLTHPVFDLRKGLQSILDQLQPHAHQKLLTFDVITDLDFPRFVLGDLQRLQQAVSSLVANSIQYTNKGCIVVHLGVLAAASDRCIIRISVQDSGIGMSQQELDDLFQELEQVSDEENNQDQTSEQYQTSHTNGSNSSRLGLGLALLSRYIKNSGGQVRGKSIPGKGSTFSLEVPLQLAPDALGSSSSLSHTTSTIASDTPGLATGGTRSRTRSDVSDIAPKRPSLESMKYPSSPVLPLSRLKSKPESAMFASPRREELHMKKNLAVLLADDNPVNLAILQRRLKKIGHEVQSSRDGQQCYELFQKTRDSIDFLLMDINPLVDGIQATIMIRAIEAASTDTPDTPNTRLSTAPPPKIPIGRPSTPFTASITPTSGSDAPLELQIPPTDPISMQPLTSPTHPPIPTYSLTSPNLHHVSNDPQESILQYRMISSRVQNSPSRPHSRVSSISTPDSMGSTPPTSGMPLQSPKRVPIFAISASLNQYTQEELEDAGFDGWLSKPIDFQRLDLILKGAKCKRSRKEGRYRTKDFKAGGWFN